MTTETLQHPDRLTSPQPRRITGRVTGNVYFVNSIGQATVDTRDMYQLLADGWIPVIGSGSAGGATSGTTTITFGAFPGSDFAQTLVAAVDAADPNAVVDAWILPAATADHSRDEHLVDAPIVTGYADGNGNVVITGVPHPGLNSPNPPDPMPYGAWNVGWAFSP